MYVRVGRFPVDFTSQGAIRSFVDVCILQLNCELYLSVEAIKVVQELIELLNSMRPYHKSIISISKPALRFVLRLL